MPLQNQERLEFLVHRVSQLDRVPLAELPTPLIELPNLSAALEGPRIFMKRDDLTGGLSFGGNKTRMLEFRMAPAIQEEADIIVSGFGIQSNHARQVVVAARKLGMDAKLILRRTKLDEQIAVQGNLLIDLLAGAEVTIIDATPQQQAHAIEEEVRRLRGQGRNPYRTGHHDEDLSGVSYVACALELEDQVNQLGIQPDYLYVASEGATQAGLLLYAKYTESPWQVVGVNIVDWVRDIPQRIAGIANAASERLGLDYTLGKSDVVNYVDAYRGPAYGVPTPECLEAIRLVAETEGILLEPVYTGKAMAGLIDHIRTRRIGKEEIVAFLHTGGIPALFCYADVLHLEGKLTVQV